MFDGQLYEIPFEGGQHFRGARRDRDLWSIQQNLRAGVPGTRAGQCDHAAEPALSHPAFAGCGHAGVRWQHADAQTVRDPGDAAATITAHANDTVQATSGGTIEDKWASAWSLLNGTFFEPPQKKCPIFGIGEACIISLDQAPTAAFVASGVAIVAEAP